MLRTTEPVIIMTKTELEAIICSAVKKAVSEVLGRLETQGEISAVSKTRQRSRQLSGGRELESTAAAASVGASSNSHLIVDRLLRMPQVLDRVGLKKTVIYERIKAGTFPKPIKLGSASAWHAQEIDAWIAAKTC